MKARMATTRAATTFERAELIFFGTEVQKNNNNKSNDNRCKPNTCFNDLWMVGKSKVVVGTEVQNCVGPTGDANGDALVEKDDFVMKFQEQVKKGDSVMKLQEQVNKAILFT